MTFSDENDRNNNNNSNNNNNNDNNNNANWWGIISMYRQTISLECFSE